MNTEWANIRSTNINGSVIAESVNENISVSFASITADQVMSFSSVNGDGTVIKLNTLNGDINITKSTR